MGLLDIFIAAATPVLKVLLVTALGSVLALERINILGEEARKHLNKIVYFVFNPALVASYLVETITLESLVTLWFMPVNILLTFIIGSILALVLNKVARTPQNLQGLVIGCCAAGNQGNLFLIIIPAVCDESNGPFGDPFICNKHGNAYASLSMAMSVVYIWSYVYIIMRISLRKSDGQHGSNAVVSFESSGESSEAFIKSSKTDPLLHSVSCNESSAQFASTCRVLEGKVPILHEVRRGFKILTHEINLKMLFAPTTIAAIVGFMVGIVSPIRKALVGERAPLHVIESSTYLVGGACVPAATMIVGANLIKGLKRSGVGTWIVVGIIFIRCVALPLIGIGVVKAAHHLGLVGSDRLYQFVLMLQFAVPPAVSISTITQLFEAGQSECSIVMLWSYAVSAFSLTLWSAFFMWLVA
ncbi:protein PIN-LIKES 3-like isoform X1 [Punica granatum]|uniref:Protein PIN-LIKES 3-like isoform X1 n=1 Tax=Punica granatum TaxID=22663 RepID=A0A6P8DVL7_PUNGR|nr:protein PIN-LIKES 3-like isoform X1 [Punica granatum]XP_031399781.1 protein PIN-LIKES 3-like isoform X1 [Punica granatum]